MQRLCPIFNIRLSDQSPTQIFCHLPVFLLLLNTQLCDTTMPADDLPVYQALRYQENSSIGYSVPSRLWKRRQVTGVTVIQITKKH